MKYTLLKTSRPLILLITSMLFFIACDPLLHLIHPPDHGLLTITIEGVKEAEHAPIFTILLGDDSSLTFTEEDFVEERLIKTIPRPKKNKRLTLQINNDGITDAYTTNTYELVITEEKTLTFQVNYHLLKDQLTFVPIENPVIKEGHYVEIPLQVHLFGEEVDPEKVTYSYIYENDHLALSMTDHTLTIEALVPVLKDTVHLKAQYTPSKDLTYTSKTFFYVEVLVDSRQWSIESLGEGQIDYHEGYYSLDEHVTFRAIENQGYEFHSWREIEGDSEITMDVQKEIELTALFTQYRLHVEVIGHGTVSIEPLSLTKTYLQDEEITLRAEPDEYYTFKYFLMDSIEYLDQEVQVTMDNHKSIEAFIAFGDHRLDLSILCDRVVQGHEVQLRAILLDQNKRPIVGEEIDFHLEGHTSPKTEILHTTPTDTKGYAYATLFIALDEKPGEMRVNTSWLELREEITLIVEELESLQIHIDSPIDTITNKDTVHLEGTLNREALITIKRENEPLYTSSPHYEDHFSVEISLNQGVNYIEIQVQDRWGLTHIKIFEIELDTVPPEITLDQEDTSVNSYEFEISGRVNKESTLSIEVEEELVFISPSPVTSFQETITLLKKDSMNRVSIQAIDVAGNVSKKESLKILLDTEPPIAHGLSPEITNDTVITIRVHVTDSLSGIDQDTLLLRLDDRVLEHRTSPIPSGYQVIGEDLLLEEGTYSISIEGRDYAGNSIPEEMVQVGDLIVDRTPPLIHHFFIEEEGPVQSTSVTLHIEAYDDLTMSMKIWNEDLYEEAQKFFYSPTKEWNLLPLEGERTVHLELMDKAGNRSKTSTSIELQLQELYIDPIDDITLQKGTSKEATLMAVLREIEKTSSENIDFFIVEYDEDLLHLELVEKDQLRITGLKEGEGEVTVGARMGTYRAQPMTFLVTVNSFYLVEPEDQVLPLHRERDLYLKSLFNHQEIVCIVQYNVYSCPENIVQIYVEGSKINLLALSGGTASITIQAIYWKEDVKYLSQCTLSVEVTVPLDVHVEGEGEVLLTPQKDFYSLGEEVHLEATPLEGYEFVQWEGDIESKEREIVISIEEGQEHTALFTQYRLLVKVIGNGTISIKPLSLTKTYLQDEEITLRAEPDEYYNFKYFLMDSIEYLDQEVQVTMDGHKSIEVFIEFGDHRLNLSILCDKVLQGHEVQLRAVLLDQEKRPIVGEEIDFQLDGHTSPKTEILHTTPTDSEGYAYATLFIALDEEPREVRVNTSWLELREEITLIVEELEPLQIQIDSPIDTITNKDTLHLEGTLNREALITIKRENEPLYTSSPHYEDHFSVEISLNQGVNYIEIQVQDRWGLTHIKIFEIELDTIPPEITLDQEDTSVNHPMFEISGTVDKESTLSIEVEEELVFISPSPVTSFQETITLLKENTMNQITVSAIDVAGNVSKKESLKILLDTEPPLAHSLCPEITNDSIITIKVHVTDSLSGIDQDTLLLRLDDRVLEHRTSPIPSGYQMIGEDLLLEEGTYSISVEGRDYAGNSIPEELVQVGDLIVDRTPPHIHHFFIEEEGPVQSTSVTLYIEGYDDLNMSMEIWNEDLYEEVQTLSYTPTVPWELRAQEGERTVHLRLIDEAGNRSKTSTAIELKLQELVIEEIDNITLQKNTSSELTLMAELKEIGGTCSDDIDFFIIAYDEEILYLELLERDLLEVTGLNEGEGEVTVGARMGTYMAQPMTFLVTVNSFYLIEPEDQVLPLHTERDLYLTSLFNHQEIDDSVQYNVYSSPENLVQIHVEGSKINLLALKGGTTSINIEASYIREGIAYSSPSTFSVEITVPLEVQVKGEGEILLTPQKDYYSLGEEVYLEAIPSKGYSFVQWEGDIESEEREVVITIEEDIEIRAIFEEEGTSSVGGTLHVVHNFPWAVVEERALLETDLTKMKRRYPFSRQHDVEEMIIGLSSHLTQEEQYKTLENLGYRIIDRLDEINAVLVQVPHISLLGAIERVQEHKDVLYAEPNYLVEALGTNTPDDTYYSYQWHYPLIRLPQAWTVSTGSQSIRVAVVDTGIHEGHPDLSTQVDTSTGYNFVANNHNATDDHWHGTHVAGTIGALTNNNQGVAGVMWECQLVPVKVLDRHGIGSMWNVAQGVLYAAGLLNNPYNPCPVDIINLSLGSTSNSYSLEEAIIAASNTGVIIVAASGNNGKEGLLYPAAYPQTIAVGAVDYNYPHTPKRTIYSNYGYLLDVVAPGGNTEVDSDSDGYGDGVLSTVVDYRSTPTTFDYGFAQGTSMATPHVSGVIGLMLASGIPSYQVREVIQSTAMAIGDGDFNKKYGHGLINAYWAVNHVQEIKVFVGRQEGDRIIAVAETSISPKGGPFSITEVPTGEHRIFAWVDVRGNGFIEAGDYFVASEPMYFEVDETYSIDLTIVEVDQGMIKSYREK